ncbi:MAG: AI-2E family transporter [Burkholderiaceae bacterium]|nr:MAG: AI-2E family transporter [Burkholderiaceae bacterium]
MNLTPRHLQSLYLLLLAAGLIWVLGLLASVLTPFMLAALLAYALNPLVEWLARKHWPRALATATVLFILLLALFLLGVTLVPIVRQELALTAERLPQLAEWFNLTLAPRLEQWFGWQVHWDSATIKTLIAEHWDNNREDIVTTLFSYVRGGGGKLLTLVGLLFLVPLVLFYLLLDWPQLMQRCERSIPRRWHGKTTAIAGEINVLLAQYLRGQALVMLVLALYYAAALKLAGISIGIPVGLLTGLLIVIPYLGYALGLTLALLAAVLEPGGSTTVILVAVIYGLGQVVESFFLTPRLVGKRIGLSPVAVLFALLAFGQLFGFFGVLLALPASAALLVGLRHVRVAYLASDFYRK